MKAYSFYFNTSDWLASPAVKMMSKAERGVYIGLLASAWESPVQGTLPTSVDKVRRLAEMSLDEWAESGETLLEKFPLSECGTYRYNPRLLAEATKEQARSDKAKKSADMRWQSERNANASKNNANASEKVCERNAQVKLSKGSTNVDEKAPAPETLKANPAKQMAAAHTNPDDEQHWSAGPLTKPRAFAVICERLGFLEIDFEHYRKQGLVSAEDADISRTINQWSSWIRNYLNNQLKNGPLLKMQVGGGTLPSQPTPNDQYPQPGHERPGQVFYIGGASGDQNMDKMAAAARLKFFPAATIISLAYPQAPYTLRDGNVMRG